MSHKQFVIAAIDALPDDASAERILQEAELAVALCRSIDAADRGDVTPHADFMREVQSWTKATTPVVASSGERLTDQSA